MLQNFFVMIRMSKVHQRNARDGTSVDLEGGAANEAITLKPVNNPDSIEGELTMLITITTLQSATIMSFLSFYSFEELQQFDEVNTYLSYQLAPVLTNYVWFSVQINVLSFFLAWLLYAVWRGVRPAPQDTDSAGIFFDQFSPFFLALYCSTIAGFISGGIAFYQIVVLKGGTNTSAQNTAFFFGILWFTLIFIISSAVAYKYYVLRNQLLNILSEGRSNRRPSAESFAMANPMAKKLKKGKNQGKSKN